MFHMLSCFNLVADTTLPEFRESLRVFNEHMANQDLIHSVGPIGRRRRDTIMDTDEERDQEYFFIMSFRDDEQVDRSIAYIRAIDDPGTTFHTALFAQVKDAIFISWQDID